MVLPASLGGSVLQKIKLKLILMKHLMAKTVKVGLVLFFKIENVCR